MITGSHKFAKWYRQEAKFKILLEVWRKRYILTLLRSGRKKTDVDYGNSRAFWKPLLTGRLQNIFSICRIKGFVPTLQFLFHFFFLISSTSKQFITYISASKILKKHRAFHADWMRKCSFFLLVWLQRSQRFLVRKTSERTGTRSGNFTNRTKCFIKLVFFPPCNVPS